MCRIGCKLHARISERPGACQNEHVGTSSRIGISIQMPRPVRLSTCIYMYQLAMVMPPIILSAVQLKSHVLSDINTPQLRLALIFSKILIDRLP